MKGMYRFLDCSLLGVEMLDEMEKEAKGLLRESFKRLNYDKVYPLVTGEIRMAFVFYDLM